MKESGNCGRAVANKKREERFIDSKLWSGVEERTFYNGYILKTSYLLGR